MANSEKSKTEKRLRLSQRQKQNAAVIFAALLIAVYIAAELYSAFNVSLKTDTALVSTVYETIDSQALVVRDEQIVQGGGDAAALASVGDCEKVKRGGEIALTFSTQEQAAEYSRYLQLEEELEYYANMESQAVGRAAAVESLDSDILEDVNEYVRAAARGNFKSVSEYASDLNDRFTRRQILIGQQIDFSSVMRETEDEMNALSVSKPSGSITAAESGVFSSYTDGLESSFDYSAVKDGLDCETLSSWIQQAQSAEQTGAAGKLITSFEWYFCAVVDAQQVSELENGKSVDVAVSGTDSVYRCRIVSGAQPEPGAQTTALVLACDDINSDTASMRIADIEIRAASHTGIKMPSAAVHVKDGERGVYALVASVVEWRSAEVLYTQGDYVVLSYDADSKDGIKLYDQIIIQGKDLHDGKVYT